MDTVRFGFTCSSEKKLLNDVVELQSDKQEPMTIRSGWVNYRTNIENIDFVISRHIHHQENDIPIYLKVEFSKFQNFQDFLEWSTVFMKDKSKSILKAHIKRLDYCVDIASVDFDTLYRSTYRERSRVYNVYSNKQDGSSIYFGQKEQIYFYEKKAPSNFHDDFGQEVSKNERFVRFETRRINVPKSLSALPSLSKKNPFNTLKIMKLDYVLIDTLKGTSKNKAKALLFDIDTYGLAKALKIHRENKNYSSINKYLVPFDGLELYQAHQNRMESFFGRDYKFLKQTKS